MARALSGISIVNSCPIGSFGIGLEGINDGVCEIEGVLRVDLVNISIDW